MITAGSVDRQGCLVFASYTFVVSVEHEHRHRSEHNLTRYRCRVILVTM
jgi:hypothetical protein